MVAGSPERWGRLLACSSHQLLCAASVQAVTLGSSDGPTGAGFAFTCHPTLSLCLAILCGKPLSQSPISHFAPVAEVCVGHTAGKGSGAWFCVSPDVEFQKENLSVPKNFDYNVLLLQISGCCPEAVGYTFEKG